jgi:putative hemolysin
MGFLYKEKSQIISSRVVSKTLRIPKWISIILMRILFVSKINRRCRKIKHNNIPLKLLEGYFSQQNIKLKFSGLENIPKKGAFIMISNHPYGFLDGLIMLKLLSKEFSKVKITANFLLKKIPLFSKYAIAVNPFDNIGKKAMGGTQQVMNNLNEDNPVVLFPAGMVSTNYDGYYKQVRDKEWKDSSKRLIADANVPVFPVYFPGKNSWLFHLMGKIHPILRTMLIPYEFVKVKNTTVSCFIGKELDKELMNKGYDPEKMYLDFTRGLVKS